MDKLPHWVVTDMFPARFDLESATAIEQTAKVYGKMNELIDSYNKWIDSLNKHIENFENGQLSEYELYKTAMRQEFQDFIDTIDLKVQDLTNYMRDNLRESCQGLLDELSADAREALESIINIRDNVEGVIETQNRTIDNQSSILAVAIKRMDEKHTEQDTKIDDAVNYMKNNLTETIETTVSNMIENGEIVIGLIYNEAEKELSLSARNIKYDTDLTLTYDAETKSILIKEGE